MADGQDDDTFPVILHQLTTELCLALVVHRIDGETAGHSHGVAVGLDVPEVVMLGHIFIDLPVGIGGIGKEGAVEDIHTFHHAAHDGAEGVRIQVRGVAQYKTNGSVVALVGQILAALAAAC